MRAIVNIPALSWVDADDETTVSTTMDESLVSQWIDCYGCSELSLGATHTTGTSPVGELTLEERNSFLGETTIPGTTVAVPVASKPARWNIAGRGSKQVRIKFTFTSGTAVISGEAFGRGE